MMENSTLVSVRALLLVLENIESNIKLKEKHPSKDKAKGANSKRKMESIDSCIPKKDRKDWTDKHYLFARKIGVCIPLITPRSASATTGVEAAKRLRV